MVQNDIFQSVFNVFYRAIVEIYITKVVYTKIF